MPIVMQKKDGHKGAVYIILGSMKKKCMFMLPLWWLSCFPLSAVEYWAQGVEDFFYTQQVGPTGCGRATAASLVYWWQRESGLSDSSELTLDQIITRIDQHFIDSGDPLTGGTFVHDGLK